MYSSICSLVIGISSILHYIKFRFDPKRFPETLAKRRRPQHGRRHSGRAAGFPLETDQLQDNLGVGGVDQLGDPAFDLLLFLQREVMVETKPHSDRLPLNC